MRKILLLTAILVFLGVNNYTIQAQTNVPFFIQQNFTLTNNASPWIISGQITIASSATLTIEEGTEVRLKEGSEVNVFGKILINGTLQNRVTILSAKTTGSSNWNSINIINSSETSIIANTIVRNGTHSVDENLEASINIINSRCMIQGLDIISDKPIYAFESDSIVILNSRIRSNTTCDLIHIKNSTGVKVSGCDLKGNDSEDTDGIDLDGVSFASIEDNILYDFTGSNSDALDIGESSTGINIAGNRFFNIIDKGISVGQGSNAEVFRNLFINCGMGIGVKDFESVAICDRNTFYGNDYGVASYEKNPGAGGGNIHIMNSVFSACNQAPYYKDSLSALTFGYCIADNQTLPGGNNLFTVPGFKNPRLNDFSLLSNSPCINGGNPESPPDEDGTRADIGAGMNPPVDISYPVVINEINYNSPLEHDADDWIEIYNSGNEDLDISGWIVMDESNQHFFCYPDGYILKSGGYTILLRDEMKFSQIFPEVNNYLVNEEFRLNNNGEMIRIFTGKLSLVDYVIYNDDSPWPVKPDGLGATLSLVSPSLDNSLAESWKSSIEQSGTPGAANFPTSVEITAEYPECRIYPNPSTSEFNIEIPGLREIRVFDAQGVEISPEINFNNQGATIRFSSERRGNYFIKMWTKTSKEELRKVIRL